MKFIGDRFVYGVTVLKPRHRKAFDFFPAFVDEGARHHFFHLAEKLVRIIHAVNGFDAADEVAGQDGVEVDGANKVRLFHQQEEKQADVIFRVEKKAGGKDASEPLLPEGQGLQGYRIFQPPAHQRYCIPVFCQRAADAVHALVVAEVVGNGKI